eukprot:1187596-Prorocentrum_minimum.AAC.1
MSSAGARVSLEEGPVAVPQRIVPEDEQRRRERLIGGGARGRPRLHEGPRGPRHRGPQRHLMLHKCHAHRQA